MRELIEKRTPTAKHFDLGNGICRLEAHVGQIHYRDGASKDGVYCDIDTTLEYYEASRGFGVTKASYEAQIGLYGDVQFHNVDHSIGFRLPNPNRVEAQAYDDSAFGRLQKALIWRDILQPGGHQIVEARNGSLAKIFRFDRKQASNTIEFQVVGSQGLAFFDGAKKRGTTFQCSGRQLNFKGGSDRLSWIRRPRAWNHRRESVDVALQFFTRGSEIWVRKIIPQPFIDATFVEAGAWLETDTTTSFYAGAGDGKFERGTVSETWATIRTGAQNNSDITGVQNTCGGFLTHADSPNYQNYRRGIFPINTSGLGAASIISAGTFYLFGYLKLNNLGGAALSLDNCTAENYAIGYHDGIRQASDISYASFNTAAYNPFALNSTGLSNINKTGTTRFSTRMSQDLDNSAPTWQSEAWNAFGCYFSEQTGTSQDPYLGVTYELRFDFFNRNQISKPHYRM